MIRGKGKKRLRGYENRSVSQFPRDSTTAPDPLAPKEKMTAAAAPHGKCEGDYGKPMMSNDQGGASSSSTSIGTNQKGKYIAWPVERLRREGFTHVVCAPSTASRTSLWDELVMPGSEGASEKTSWATEGGWVNVVGVDWLARCLGEKVSAGTIYCMHTVALIVS